MRISQDALEKCEPLFERFIHSMWAIRNYHLNVFEGRWSDRDLFSETLRVLNSYQQDRTQSAYCVLVNGFVWDAEIIIRTLYEAFSKAAFLATANEARRDALLTEFWEVLPTIYDRQTALKAAAAEKLAKHVGKSDDERVFSHLRDPAAFHIDPVGNKRSRNEIEQRWSFSGILSALRSGKVGHARLAWIDGLAHTYGLSSHLVHADPRAFELLEDRTLRGDDLVPLEVGHVCRMLVDMVSLTSFSLHLSERSWTGVQEMSVELHEAYRAMAEATEPYQSEFNRSQDDFYASRGL